MPFYCILLYRLVNFNLPQYNCFWVINLNRIRELREERNLSQAKLAKELNLAQQTISGYENNSRVFDTEKAVRLAKYFNVSVDYLLGHSDIRTPYPASPGNIEHELEKILLLLQQQDMVFLENHSLDKKMRQLIICTLEILTEIVKTRA